MVNVATVLVSVTLSGIAALLVTEYQLRREQSIEVSAELEEWYTDSASYASQARRTWQQLFEDADRPNLKEIQSELSLLSKQMSRHASQGEQIGADPRVVEKLDDLASECYRVGEASVHMNSASEFAEYRKDGLEVVEDLRVGLDGHGTIQAQK